MFSLPASIFNLFLLTAERFVSIIFPYKHCKVFTKKSIMTLLIFIWTYIVSAAIFPIIINNNAVFIINGHCHLTFSVAYVIYQLTLNFIVPLLCIIIMNIVIYRVASKHCRELNKRHVSLCTSTKSEDASRENKKQRREKKKSVDTIPRNFRAAKNIMVLFGVFLFCWLTFIVLVVWNILCRICHPREVTWTGNAINYSSVILNPLLYGLLNKKVRKVLWRRYTVCLIKRTCRTEMVKLERLSRKNIKC